MAKIAGIVLIDQKLAIHEGLTMDYPLCKLDSQASLPGRDTGLHIQAIQQWLHVHRATLRNIT